MDDGLVWRPPDLADIPAIEALASRCDAACGTLDATLVDNLRDRLRWDGGIGELSRVVLDSGDAVGAGWASSMVTPSEVRVCLYAFAAPQRPDLLVQLMSWLDKNYPAAGDPENVLRIERVLAPATPDLPAEHIALYESLGFARFYLEIEMTRGLARGSSPPSSAATGVELKPWTAGLHRQIRDAFNDAFRQRGSEGYAQDEWDRAFGTEDFRADLSFVASHGDRVVGFVFGAVMDDPDTWEDPTIRGAGWIDVLGVTPEYQGRGVGASLLAVTLAALSEVTGRVVLRVNEDNLRAIHLYERLGFVVARKHIVYRKPPADWLATPAAAPARRGP